MRTKNLILISAAIQDHKTNLTDAFWLDASGDVTAANNSTSKTDGALGNASQRFYGVENDSDELMLLDMIPMPCYNHPQPGPSWRRVKALLAGFSSIATLFMMTIPAIGTERNWTGA